MNKICYFTFVLCCLWAVVSNVQAQEFTITQVDNGEFFGVDPGPAILLGIPNGDTISANIPDLTPANITVANDTRLFEVSSGDFISNDTLRSFDLLIGFPEDDPGFTTNLDSLPFGESFIGFATGAPGFLVFDPDIGAEVLVPASFSTIGYAQVLRTSETLEVLSTDLVSTDFASTPDSSFGITVPTPEPSSALIGALGLMAMGLGRRRS